MPIGFNADEVFSIAEQIERNGAAFYRACANNLPSAKDFLLQLAAMEDAHEKTFKQLHKSVSEQESELLAADPDGEAAQYLQNMAGGYVFDIRKKPSDTLRGNESLADICRIAIGIEKDSIVFYLGLKEMMSKNYGKDKIDAIIKEEMRHVTLLSTKLQSL
jgi:rubrerythrin